MFVLDASLALAWCFEDEGTEFTEAVLAEVPAVGAAVPDIWVYEVGNALWSALRRGRISAQDADEFATRLGSLPILRVPLETVWVLDEVRSTAAEHGISVYDAAYLALARRLRQPLGTLDGTGKRVGLEQAAAACGVSMLSLETVRSWHR